MPRSATAGTHHAQQVILSEPEAALFNGLDIKYPCIVVRDLEA